MLYIHFPFCHSRCYYCGFYSTVARPDSPVFSEYVRALSNEFRLRRPWLEKVMDGHRIQTVYMGGGTPSLIPVDELEKLLSTLRLEAGQMWQPHEVTIEVNPDDVTAERVARWREMGINRASIGIQSLDGDELRRCGRRHNPEQARKAVKLLTDGFSNVSVDLIIGLPDQTENTLQDTLQGLQEMNPQHVSAYMLEVEPGTPLAKLEAMGKVSIPVEKYVEDRYMTVCETLVADGYEHYEISNFAKPGYSSRHNSSYWTGNPYLGLGPGSASYDGVRHRINVKPELGNYLNALGSGTPADIPLALYEQEHLTDEQLRDEYLLTRLRRKEGFMLKEYESLFGVKESERLRRPMARLIEQGYLTSDGEQVALTYPQGILWSDGVICTLVSE